VSRNPLKEQASTGSVDSQEAPLTRLTQSASLRQYFSQDVTIKVYGHRDRVYRWQGRDELVQAAMAARSQAAALKIEFLDMLVDLNPDGMSASVHLTAKAEMTGDQGIQVQELRLGLRKIDGDWKITQVETIETLKK
jgi:hypothetical protein